MIILNIFLFHLLCCLLSAVVIAFNLTFSSYQSTEIVLYIIHSLFIIICYFLFGYKIITTNKISFSFNAQIWILTIIIIIFSFLDINMACLINLPFQTISSVLYGTPVNEKTLCIITALIPSALIQIGSVCGFLCARK